jgi:hypothetical protein
VKKKERPGIEQRADIIFGLQKVNAHERASFEGARRFLLACLIRKH